MAMDLFTENMASPGEASATAANAADRPRGRTPPHPGVDPSPTPRPLVVALAVLALALALAAADYVGISLETSPPIGWRRLQSRREEALDETDVEDVEEDLDVKDDLHEIEDALLSKLEEHPAPPTLKNVGRDAMLKSIAKGVLEVLDDEGGEDDDPELAWKQDTAWLFKKVEEQLVYLEGRDGEFFEEEKEGLEGALRDLVDPAFPKACPYVEERPAYYEFLEDAERQALDRRRERWDWVPEACGRDKGGGEEGSDPAPVIPVPTPTDNQESPVGETEVSVQEAADPAPVMPAPIPTDNQESHVGETEVSVEEAADPAPIIPMPTPTDDQESHVGETDGAVQEAPRPDDQEDEGESHSHVLSSLVMLVGAVVIATAGNGRRIMVAYGKRLPCLRDHFEAEMA